MKSTIVLACILSLAVGVLLYADRQNRAVYPAWEMRSLLPHEISPGRYAQVTSSELDRVLAEGWQLVSVTAYVILNEERGPEGRKTAVTQAYPGYYFQRQKPARD